jgi:cytidine deaminase
MRSATARAAKAPRAQRAKRLRASVAPDAPNGTALRRLVAAARAVRRRAYAPHSNFHVGAAVLDERGRMHVGCNVENASFGLTICAERNAMAAAVAAGARRLRAVAVVTGTHPPGSPCGACRQVLAEFGADDLPVLLASPTGQVEETHLGALLPRAFRL